MESEMADSLSTIRLSIDFLLSVMNHDIVPIANLVIPNIYVPPNLLSKKRHLDSSDTITSYIRNLLNSITEDNIDKAKEQLLKDINYKVESEVSLNEIADELLYSFIVS